MLLLTILGISYKIANALYRISIERPTGVLIIFRIWPPCSHWFYFIVPFFSHVEIDSWCGCQKLLFISPSGAVISLFHTPQSKKEKTHLTQKFKINKVKSPIRGIQLRKLFSGSNRRYFHSSTYEDPPQKKNFKYQNNKSKKSSSNELQHVEHIIIITWQESHHAYKK